MNQVHSTLPRKALSIGSWGHCTSLGMAMHTAWLLSGDPACPLNTLEWNIPHYSYHNLGHHQRIMYRTGKWWPTANQITSLTHKTVFTTSTYCTHSEGWGPREKWVFQISLWFKGIYFLFLTCSCLNFRNGTPKSYWIFQRLRCFKGVRNFLQELRTLGATHSKVHVTQITQHQCS